MFKSTCRAGLTYLLQGTIVLLSLQLEPCLGAPQSLPTAAECVKLLHSDNLIKNKNSDPNNLPDGSQKVGDVSIRSWRPTIGPFAKLDNLCVLALSIKDKDGAFAVETAVIKRSGNKKLSVIAHNLFYETQLVVDQGEGAGSVLSSRPYIVANNVQAFGVSTESWFHSTSTEVSGETLTLFVPQTSGTIDAVFCQVMQSDDDKYASTVTLTPPITKGYFTLTLTSGRKHEKYSWDGSSYQRAQQRRHK